MAPFWSFSSSSRGPSHHQRGERLEVIGVQAHGQHRRGNRRQGEQQHRAGEQVGD